MILMAIFDYNSEDNKTKKLTVAIFAGVAPWRRIHSLKKQDLSNDTVLLTDYIQIIKHFL
jgi:hypothetical protein